MISLRSAWPIIVTQILSVLIAGTAVASAMLAGEFGIECPTLQSTGNYLLLLLVYGSYYVYKGAFESDALKRIWWQYALLALVDFEANYAIVKAYQYTSVTSVQVLDAATIIFVLLLSYFALKQRYSALHYFCVAVIFGGMALMIYSDVANSDSLDAKWFGSLLVVFACFLYAIANISTEYIVKNRPDGRIEYLAHVGLWGSIWSSIQLALFERAEVRNLFAGNVPIAAVGWFFCFWCCLFAIYSLMPIAFSISSAVFVNLGNEL